MMLAATIINIALFAALVVYVTRRRILRGEGRHIVHYRCDGCMAHDWVEIERGVIVGFTSRVLYGSPTPTKLVKVELTDGTLTEYFASDCMPYATDMLVRAGEDLTGKWVYLR